jgi:hypothetical protein
VYCFSSFCVSYVASFCKLSIFDCPCILQRLFSGIIHLQREFMCSVIKCTVGWKRNNVYYLKVHIDFTMGRSTIIVDFTPHSVAI